MPVRPLGVPRTAVDVMHEQPLPWRAAAVTLTFPGGKAVTCRVSRHPGDLIRTDDDTVNVPTGTTVEIQWTQDGLGGYASGTVVDAPAGEAAGVYIRVEKSVTGVERRVDARTPVAVLAGFACPTGRFLLACTEDLSLGGVRIIVDPADGTTLDRVGLARLGITPGIRGAVDLALPNATIRIDCTVTAVDLDTASMRLRFIHGATGTVDHLSAFLAAQDSGSLPPRKP
jgi:hypothetical protein